MKPFRVFAVVALALIVVGTASAQSNFNWVAKSSAGAQTTVLPPDLQKVNYFSNAHTAGAPDGTVEITNPGSPAGNLCAQIYVFDAFQELSECCACEVTPNGLRTLSVNTDLTSNPATGVTLSRGEVSIVSGIVPPSGVCNPLNYITSPTIRAWGTHIQNGNFAVTETEYSERQLGAYNDNLLLDCFAIAITGSGHGVCSCGSGD